MTKIELIKAMEEMPNDAKLIWSSSFYTSKGEYRGSAYIELEKIDYYDTDSLKDKIYLG